MSYLKITKQILVTQHYRKGSYLKLPKVIYHNPGSSSWNESLKLSKTGEIAGKNKSLVY